MTDKIPIGKYHGKHTFGANKTTYFIVVNLKDDIHKDGDIITLDMIEPYESIAVRKVTEYLLETFSVSIKEAPNRAQEIVALVHEAEDADE